jgi:hypothetical protein
LRTLVLGKIGGYGTDTTFRLLADNMPALRELKFSVLHQPPQDGFIELVSRLRSLSLSGCRRPWDSVHDAGGWPLTLPNLEGLTWPADDALDAVAVALLRRAVFLRAAHVSYASALVAIAAGPVADDGDPNLCAPLSSVRALTLTEVVDDATSLATTLAASSRVSALTLQWGGTAPELCDLLRAVASAAPSGAEEAAPGYRVRRVDLKLDCDVAVFESQAAEECILALFPRTRSFHIHPP